MILIVIVTILLFLNASFLASESVEMLSTSAANYSPMLHEQPNISSNCTTTTLRFLVEFQAESSHVKVPCRSGVVLAEGDVVEDTEGLVG